MERDREHGRYLVKKAKDNPSTDMGVRGLSKLIETHAPESIKAVRLEDYKGKVIAVDAQLQLYQLMHGALSGVSTETVAGPSASVAMDTYVGNKILQGVLSRTVRMLAAGIRPVYVFDGKLPPEKRRKKENKSEGVRWVTPDDIRDCKRLLGAMGVLVVDAASEAEAQCAEMVKRGTAWITVSEDMDTLAFGSMRMVRGLFTEDPREYDLEKAKAGLGMTSQDMFVDLCILCGCDYCSTLPGVGPVRALQNIRNHGGIDGVIAVVGDSKRKTHVNLSPFTYQEARNRFLHPGTVSGGEDLFREDLAMDGVEMRAFLVEERGLCGTMVTRHMDRLKNESKPARNRGDQQASA
jgi:flap endonuclease-1